MIAKRPFHFLLQIFTGLYLAFIFFKGPFMFRPSVVQLISCWGLMMALLGISHFKERRLPYFYPSLFMFGVMLAMLYWARYKK